MLLLLVLVATLGRPASPAEHDLAAYLALAARYGAGQRLEALRDLRAWSPAEIRAAVQATQHAGHLQASMTLYEWSRKAAARLRERAVDAKKARGRLAGGEPPLHTLRVRERIAPRDYYAALAATALAFGFPLTARSYAHDAVRAAPLDGEAHLLEGCVDASLAEVFVTHHQDSDAERSRRDAERALRDALAIEPGELEARLRLGKLLLDERRAVEAEPLLIQVERGAFVAFHHEVKLVEPLTEDVAAVRRALDAAASRGSTALVDAVYAALRLPETPERRRVIVVFSDGVDNISWLAAPEVLEAARRSSAIVYAVSVRAQDDPKERFLGDVARATGGRLFDAPDERHLRERFLDVLGDVRARYVLRYTPRGQGRAGWHAVEVRLRRGKGDVLARPGYWRSGPQPH